MLALNIIENKYAAGIIACIGKYKSKRTKSAECDLSKEENN